MKLFFGIDVTQNQEKTAFDGDVFTEQQVTQAQKKALDDNLENLHAMEEQAKLPLAFRIAKFAAMLLAVCGFVGILRADVSLQQAYKNAPWVFYGTAIAAVIWGLLAIWERQRTRKVAGAEENQLLIKRNQTIRDNAYSMLEVPVNAPLVDVLAARYQVKNDKVKIVNQGLEAYTNPEMRIFVKNGVLYLADLERKYAIPKEELVGIRKIDKRRWINSWNKETAYNEGVYKQYKMTTNNYGQIFFKPYYQLIIRHADQEYALEFPPYELEVFQILTGCKPAE